MFSSYRTVSFCSWWVTCECNSSECRLAHDNICFFPASEDKSLLTKIRTHRKTQNMDISGCPELLHRKQLYDGLLHKLVSQLTKLNVCLFFLPFEITVKRNKPTSALNNWGSLSFTSALNSGIGIPKRQTNKQKLRLTSGCYGWSNHWTFFLLWTPCLWPLRRDYFCLHFAMFPLLPGHFEGASLIWLSKDIQRVDLIYLSRIGNFILVLPWDPRDTFNNIFEKSMSKICFFPSCILIDF